MAARRAKVEAEETEETSLPSLVIDEVVMASSGSGVGTIPELAAPLDMAEMHMSQRALERQRDKHPEILDRDGSRYCVACSKRHARPMPSCNFYRYAVVALHRLWLDRPAKGAPDDVSNELVRKPGDPRADAHGLRRVPAEDTDD